MFIQLRMSHAMCANFLSELHDFEFESCESILSKIEGKDHINYTYHLTNQNHIENFASVYAKYVECWNCRFDTGCGYDCKSVIKYAIELEYYIELQFVFDDSIKE